MCEVARRLSSVAGKKKRQSHSALKLWRIKIGEEVKRVRGEDKQDAFAERVGVSTSTLSIIENGSRDYGVDALLRVLAAMGPDPAKAVLTRKFETHNARHMELHDRLQELLDADGDWPMAAAVNVDAVWSLYQERRKKKKVS